MKTGESGFTLQAKFPIESPRELHYAELGLSIAETVITKQKAYGDSFGKSREIMRVLYPEGIPPEKLGDALTVIRVIDKLFRIATDRDALGESPWRDIAGYALLATARLEQQRAMLESPPLPPSAGFDGEVLEKLRFDGEVLEKLREAERQKQKR